MKPSIFCLIALVSILGCNSLTKLSNDEISISGTKWNYTDSDWSYVIGFNHDGTIVSSHPNDHTPDNDKWTQHRRKVSFQFNEGFSKYEGTLKSLNVIEGKAYSEAGSWDWEMKRIK